MMKPKSRIKFLAFLCVGLIHSLFMGTAHAQLRPMIYADVTVDAPISDVWEDWTTEAGVTSFFAKAAEIEMKPGGAYRLYFAPSAPEGSAGMIRA